VSTDVGERVRRTRLGPVLRDGGEASFPSVQRVVTEELGWDAARWEQELARYRETWKAQHAVPAAA